MNIPDRIGRRTLLIVVILSMFPPPRIGAETLTLRPGFQQILERTGVHRISIGNPDIIEAHPLPGKAGILVVGKQEGETDLVLWDKATRSKWTVVVRESDGGLLEETLRFASVFPGLSVVAAGRSVILRGKVGSSYEKAMIGQFAAGRKGVLSQVTIPEEEKTLLS